MSVTYEVVIADEDEADTFLELVQSAEEELLIIDIQIREVDRS